ncbi:MAG TPA: HD domain-containing protein [Thermomicrobiaceae bacterium]|nr:HD domain-containing protein [Thermomicrobiaceae bacterium]
MSEHVDLTRSPAGAVTRVERHALLEELTRLGLLTPRVQQGVALADEAHAGQLRAGGGSYLEEHIYPVTQETARFLAAHHTAPAVAEDAVLAALLHDTIEDSAWVSRGLLRERFGPEVARAVTALTRPSVMYKLAGDEDRYIDELRALGPRVMTVKVFDRLNNLASLHLRPQAARERYLAESRDYYLPLAELIDPALVDQMAALISHQESRLLDEE